VTAASKQRIAARLLAGGLVALLAVTSTGVTHGQTPDRAPDVRLVTVDGKDLLASGWKGVSELVFVARWCQPCETRLLETRRRGVRGAAAYRVIVVGSETRQSEKAFASWLDSLGLDGVRVYDAGGKLEKAFGVRGLPWHVVVGEGGTILHASDEPPSEADRRSWSGARR
jgi:hypothetical protein